MIDCLIIGFNDLDIGHYERLVRAMGTDSGSYRDLALALVHHHGKPYRSLDLLTDLYYEGRERPRTPLHNTDFLWPTISYLGSYLQRRGFTFEHVDQFHFAHQKDKLRQALRRGDVRTVAVTTTLYVIPEPILEIIEFVRKEDQDVKIIVGGPYISNNTGTLDDEGLQRFFKLLGADFYVDSSEGEQALVGILSALRDSQDFDAIPNIAFRRGDHYIKNPTETESSDLDAEMVQYHLFNDDIGQFVSLRTAKSCPFSCAFCGFPARAGKYRYLSVDRVEAELDAIRDLGTVTTLTFLDDTFNVPKKRFKELLRMMIRKRYGFRWNSFYRSDHGDEETVALMAEAGCEGVFLGAESGSDTILQKMKKTARRHDYLAAIPLLKQHGIITHANLIIGFPGETIDTFQETVDLIETAQPDFFRAQLWYADPMTPVWDRRDELGIRGEAFWWSHHTMDWRTASDLVDRLFLSIENSIWLPQFGFELWSLFYLERFGMSREQVKTFVRCFNAIIKARMTASSPANREHPLAHDIDGELFAALRKSARFDRGETPDMRAVEVYSGAAYAAAESFWGQLFGGSTPPALLPRRGDESADIEPGQASQTWALPVARCEGLRAVLDADLAAIAVAAYVVILLRLSGSHDIALMVEEPDLHVPLRVRIDPARSFRALVAEIQRLRANAAHHARLAFHFIENKQRMALYGAEPPRLDIGFQYADDGAGCGAEHGARASGLVLSATRSARGLEFRMHWRARLPDSLPDSLGESLMRVLEQAAEQPDCAVGEIGEGRDRVRSAAVWHGDAEEAFNF